MSMWNRRAFLADVARKGVAGVVAVGGFGGASGGLLSGGFLAAPRVLAAEPSGGASKPATVAEGDGAWDSLFDGKSLGLWKPTPFSGGAETRIQEGAIWVGQGEELSGFHFQGKAPELPYEFELEAQRLSGLDFFCAVTFPVGPRFLTFVVGGWGGSVVGISSINGEDASRNESTSYRQFKDKVWYRVRLRVEAQHLQAWIDQDRVVDVDLKGKEIDLRPGEIDLSCPLGVATFRTEALFRNLRLRRLPN
jgi:hypothetical protein